MRYGSTWRLAECSNEFNIFFLCKRNWHSVDDYDVYPSYLPHTNTLEFEVLPRERFVVVYFSSLL
jgi:hypothetical protein